MKLALAALLALASSCAASANPGDTSVKVTFPDRAYLFEGCYARIIQEGDFHREVYLYCATMPPGVPPRIDPGKWDPKLGRPNWTFYATNGLNVISACGCYAPILLKSDWSNVDVVDLVCPAQP